jgi:cytochrome c biogenesis protein CcmG/thiol:disulfide interchange protein DsbE
MSGRILRWLLVPVVVVPLAWLLVASLGRAVPRVGDPAPAFSLSTIDGEQVSSTELAGKPYVLNFWASWCVPACVDEHPVLIEAQRRYGDDVTILGVLYRDSPAGARAFLERYGDGGWQHLSDPGERLAGEWGVLGPPESFLVDADGRVAARWIGPLTAADLDAFMAPVAVLDR